MRQRYKACGSRACDSSIALIDLDLFEYPTYSRLSELRRRGILRWERGLRGHHSHLRLPGGNAGARRTLRGGDRSTDAAAAQQRQRRAAAARRGARRLLRRFDGVHERILLLGARYESTSNTLG